jgi:hypothetical protein
MRHRRTSKRYMLKCVKNLMELPTFVALGFAGMRLSRKQKSQGSGPSIKLLVLN